MGLDYNLGEATGKETNGHRHADQDTKDQRQALQDIGVDHRLQPARDGIGRNQNTHR